MICDVCKSNETYVKKYNHEYLIKGKKICFTADRRFCSKCNNLIYDSVLDNKASSVAIKKYNEKYGVEKEKIIELRTKLGLSQELFSKVIGCAKKTLISYEKGTSIPNDSYLIIIKSLLANPKTIFNIIAANKEQFTEKEYDKLNSKLNTSLSNNSKQLLSNDVFEPTEFNGYTELNKDKIFNMILFFADKNILKTQLLKEMFYADFLFYKSTCKSITGLEYCKLPFGPVPDQYENILSLGIKDNLIDYDCEIKKEYECYKISAKEKFDKKIFNKEELKILNVVKNKFKDFNSKDIVNFSHQEKAFLETEYLNKISYDLAFDITSIK